MNLTENTIFVTGGSD